MSLNKKIGGRFAQVMHQTLLIVLVSFCVVGCLSNGTGGGGAATSTGSRGFSSTTTGGTSSTSTDSQCTVFGNNANDFATCISCKQSLCPCTTYFPNSNTCQTTDITSCTVSEQLLVACVHENVRSSGGNCTGLKCGDNQVADFVNCACKDATPPSSIGPAPGQEDQSSPYMEPGFFVGNRFCPSTDTTPQPTFTPVAHQCLLDGGGAGTDNGVPAGATANLGTPPKHVTQAPVNVFTDVGYLRWDLALDGSQFSPLLPFTEKLSFTATQGTFVGTASMYYQLKPNTALQSEELRWVDCVEHFSGESLGTGANGVISTNNACEPRLASVQMHAPPAVTITVSKNNSYSGTAKMENMSVNGPASNANLTTLNPAGNPNLKLTTAAALGSNFGMGKQPGSMTGAAATAVGATPDYNFTRDENYVSGSTGGTGLFSNVGYYKYTWGPLGVKKLTNTSDISSSSVTGRIALNVNLGYSPTSLVQSSAYSPEGVLGRVATRDCSSSVTPNTCVITGVYRAPGGSVMTQSYSPRFPGSRQATSVDALPVGMTAAATPKIVEDISQMAKESTPAATSTVTAPRLRVFSRSIDGNVYMSRFFAGKWAEWKNLGRPWVCDPNGGSGTGTQCDGTTQPAALRGYNSDNYSALSAPRVWDHAANTSIDPNNGISIAGEPVVASFMDTSVGAGNGVPGYIAVFVRVSHMKSTAGTASLAAGQGITYGPYHNAIFYTVAAVSTAPIAISATPYFDVVSNWSQWQPVMTGTGEVMRIQGNPTAFIAKHTANNQVRAYIFGTEAPGLHPPIAPLASQNTFANLDGTIRRGWYNYGNTLVYSSLLLGGTYENVSGNYTGNLARASWAAFGRYLVATAKAPDGANPANSDQLAITSDWSWAPVDQGVASLSTYQNIRLIASGYQTVEMRSVVNELGVSPFKYTDRKVYFVEFRITNAGNFLDPTDAGGGCAGSYASHTTAGTTEYLGFVGNVHAVNLGDHANAGTIGSPAATTSKMFIFGRAPCPTKACDNVNPSVAYMTVNADTECVGASPLVGAFEMYFSARSSTSTTTRTVQQVYTSSDVIPAYSNALDVGSTDVPVYLLFRNASGNISSGSWNSKKAGTEGSKQFFFGPSGGLTN